MGHMEVVHFPVFFFNLQTTMAVLTINVGSSFPTSSLIFPTSDFLVMDILTRVRCYFRIVLM